MAGSAWQLLRLCSRDNGAEVAGCNRLAMNVASVRVVASPAAVAPLIVRLPNSALVKWQMG